MWHTNQRQGNVQKNVLQLDLLFVFHSSRCLRRLTLHDFIFSMNKVYTAQFQERLSEKVHATIPRGIVGDFEFTVFQRNFKELHEKPWTYVCEC